MISNGSSPPAPLAHVLGAAAGSPFELGARRTSTPKAGPSRAVLR